jgi:hypothetical protein
LLVPIRTGAIENVLGKVSAQYADMARRAAAIRGEEGNRGASIAGQETVNARLTRERDEALLRETANSEILRLISKSPENLKFVSRKILEYAIRICDANFGTLYRFDGKSFHLIGQFKMPKAMPDGKPRSDDEFDCLMRKKEFYAVGEYDPLMSRAGPLSKLAIVHTAIRSAHTDGGVHRARAALRCARGAEWPFQWVHPSLMRGACAPHCNIPCSTRGCGQGAAPLSLRCGPDIPGVSSRSGAPHTRSAKANVQKSDDRECQASELGG